jgi:hypothetical protein
LYRPCHLTKEIIPSKEALELLHSILIEMAENTTVIVNNTQQDLAMQVGNHMYFVPFANLAKGAKKKLRVDYNDTYQEFLMGVDKAGNKLIVTSDECCDFKCITITESDGKFDVQREPRWHHPTNSASSADSSPSSKKPSSKSS